MPIDKNQKPDISVIIPSFNHEHYIVNMLQSLEKQETDYNYQLIVVDSGTDNSASIISERFPWVELVRSKERLYPGQGRNKGVELAGSNIIAFTDTDCTISPGWVQNMVNGHKDGKNLLVGPVLNGTPKSIIGTVDYLLEFFDSWNTKDGIKIGPVGTVNVCFDRSIFETYGPLDGFVKGSDSRFFRKVLDAGETIYWLKGMSVTHHNRTKFKVVMRNQYHLGLGAAATGKVHKSRAQFMMNYPIFIPLIPFMRFIRIGWILLRKAPLKHFILYILLSPLIMLGLVVHATGFVAGALKKS